jgi:predicted DNA-binding ribbon-helix-helix protein
MKSGSQRAIYFTDELWEQLRRIAFERKCSISKVVREAVEKETGKCETTTKKLGRQNSTQEET